MLENSKLRLIENFDGDPDKIVLSFDGLTQDQKTNFKENYFWSLAFLMRQLTWLSLCEVSEDNLKNVLEALPLDLPYWARRVDPELKRFIEQNLKPAYQLAVDQIVREKKRSS